MNRNIEPKPNHNSRNVHDDYVESKMVRGERLEVRLPQYLPWEY